VFAWRHLTWSPDEAELLAGVAGFLCAGIGNVGTEAEWLSEYQDT